MRSWRGFICGLCLFAFGMSTTFLFALLLTGNQVTVVESIAWVRNLELGISIFFTLYGAYCTVYFARSKKEDR